MVCFRALVMPWEGNHGGWSGSIQQGALARAAGVWVSPQWHFIPVTEPEAGLPGEASGHVLSHRGHGGTDEGVRMDDLGLVALYAKHQLARKVRFCWSHRFVLGTRRHRCLSMQITSVPKVYLHPCKVITLLKFLRGTNRSLSVSFVLPVGWINSLGNASSIWSKKKVKIGKAVKFSHKDVYE